MAHEGEIKGRAPRVLVVYKKSTYQRLVRERKNTRLSALLEAGDIVADQLIEAHEAHASTIEEARKALQHLGVKALFRYRAEAAAANDVDLVVSIGGDGTLLWASHLVGGETPMLAINSAPDASVGHYCAAGKGQVETFLGAALEGRLKATRLERMQITRDGQLLSKRILNDALFCHPCPAATARYLLYFGDEVEEQKSSGLWVGPAAGSTAALRSAGGQVLPLSSAKLQFVVREPYQHQKAYQHIRGLFGSQTRFALRSKMDSARLYLDGTHRVHEVEIGAELCFSLSPEPLYVLGLREALAQRGQKRSPRS